MSDFRMLRAQLSMVILFLVSVLFGCAGMGLEYAPKGQYLYYHVELPAAERAVEAARRAGKDKECPEEFKTVEMMGNKAYEVYWACRTNEAIAISNEVVKRAYALCPPKKVVLPPPAPSVSLSASPATIQQGQCATLTWSSANAASASIDQGVGKVSVSGSWPVCPRSTTPYTIAAVGEGGTRSASTTVSVTPPPAPTVSLSASPATIQQGQCATLLWSSANAASASIDQGVGKVDLAGLRQVCPRSTTPYTIAAAGEGGTRSASTTVTVTPPPAPTVSLSASPAMIQQGQCATLLWSSANAASASIDQGVGSVDLSGLRQVCPTTTTPYTIAAAGEGGTRSASTTVTVTPLPPVAPKVIDRLTLHVNFDFDKSNIRNADTAELQRAVDFVTKYSGYKISIEGHTDSIGTEKYNQGLSERRAAAVKEHLLKHRVADGARIKSAGYGKSKPIADNSTEKGRFENRRVEILILSE